MLVLFYADEAYNIHGINVTYTIHSCAAECMHGTCNGAVCACNLGYVGQWCDVIACPNNCSYSLAQGL